MHNRLSSVIHELRKQYKFTQEQLGQKLGVTNKTVSKWEVGEISPDVTSLLLLSELFHVSVDELIKGFDEEDFEVNYYGSSKMRNRIRSRNRLATLIFIFGCAIMIVTNVIILRYFFVIGMINICITSIMLVVRFLKCYLLTIKRRKNRRPYIDID